jgi:hypothetical protein
MRAAGDVPVKARPLPAVLVPCRVSFLRMNESPGDTAQTSTRHLSSSSNGAGARGDARQPATITIARSKDLRVTRSPRRETRTVGPRRLPSSHRTRLADSIGGRVLPKEVDSKKRFHSTDQRMPFVTANDRQSDATDDPAARGVRTSALHPSQHPFRGPDCSVAPASVQSNCLAMKLW